MPLYEYQCEKCGDLFEVRQKFSDAPITKHEKCGGAVQRLLSAPALQFKGSGWYITDYAKGSAKSPANGGESKGDAAGKGEKKAEKKDGSAAPAAEKSSSTASETKTS